MTTDEFDKMQARVKSAIHLRREIESLERQLKAWDTLSERIEVTVYDGVNQVHLASLVFASKDESVLATFKLALMDRLARHKIELSKL